MEYNMLPEDEQAEIIRRRFICSSCPFNSSNAVVKLGYVSNRIDEHCVMCGCTITRKTASLESACGITCCNAAPLSDCTCKDKNLQEYNRVNNVNMEVKWKAYKNKTDEQQS
jgi:hypothetical protein